MRPQKGAKAAGAAAIPRETTGQPRDPAHIQKGGWGSTPLGAGTVAIDRR
jgi:hypothetical protein